MFECASILTALALEWGRARSEKPMEMKARPLAFFRMASRLGNIRNKLGCVWQANDRCFEGNATYANRNKWFVLPGTFTEAVKTQSSHFLQRL